MSLYGNLVRTEVKVETSHWHLHEQGDGKSHPAGGEYCPAHDTSAQSRHNVPFAPKIILFFRKIFLIKIAQIKK
jgi:hypothetical protein